MAYTPVPTKTTGELWAAVDNNTYIRDNFAAGVPDIFTTKGDLAVATAADVAARLGVGTNGYILTAASGEATGLAWALNPVIDLAAAKGDIVSGSAADTLVKTSVGADGSVLVAASGETGGVAWSGAAFARYTNADEQTISDNTVTIVDYETSVFDTASAVTTGASWKFTVPAGQAGYYLICASVKFDDSAGWEVGEYADLRLYKNNGLVSYLDRRYIQAAGTFSLFLTGSDVISLAVGDYIDIRVYGNSDGNLVVDNDADLCHVAIARLF